MGRRVSLWLVVLVLCVAGPSSAQKTETLQGYAEWRKGDALIVDGQRVVTDTRTWFKGKGITRLASIPLGHEVKIKGSRLPDGTILARELDAQPNKNEMFEDQVWQATDSMEREWVQAGEVIEGGERRKSLGELSASGARVQRTRAIVARLVPPYLDAGDFRVYVVANKDWNAMAMANGSIWVFSGLVDDTDDDEMAIILGHELAHVTHEHTRREFRKALWVQLIAAGVQVAAEAIDNDTTRTVVQAASAVAALSWVNHYSREQEDQADRVGLRYAYEAGYDAAKAPRLWQRFATKYGSGNRVVNFIFGGHSTSSARIANLQQQLAWNFTATDVRYASLQPAGEPVAPARLRRQDTKGSGRPAGRPAAPAMTQSAGGSREILPGMSPETVRRILGECQEEIVSGDQVTWVYPGLAVVFVKGKVTDVRF